MSPAKTEYACAVLSKGGIKVFAFLMLFNFWEENNKLEHETTEEVRKTITFIYRLWRERKLCYSSWAFAIPVPGAEFYDLAFKHGLIDKDYYPSSKNGIATNIFRA